MFSFNAPSSYTLSMLQEKDLPSRIHSSALKSEEAVALPPEFDSAQVTAEFEEDLADRPELIATLQQGTVLHPVGEARQKTIFAVDGPTKNFWIRCFTHVQMLAASNECT